MRNEPQKLLRITSTDDLKVLIDHLRRPCWMMPSLHIVSHPRTGWSVILQVGQGKGKRSYQLNRGIDYTGLPAVLFPQLDDITRQQLKALLADSGA